MPAATLFFNDHVYIHCSNSSLPRPPPSQLTPSMPTQPPIPISVELAPYFYGEVPGDDTVGHERNTCSLQCHKCHVSDGVLQFRASWHLSTVLIIETRLESIPRHYCFIIIIIRGYAWRRYLPYGCAAVCHIWRCYTCWYNIVRLIYIYRLLAFCRLFISV